MLMEQFIKSELTPLSPQYHGVVEEKQSSVPVHCLFIDSSLHEQRIKRVS